MLGKTVLSSKTGLQLLLSSVEAFKAFFVLGVSFWEDTVYSSSGIQIRGENYMLLLRWP